MRNSWRRRRGNVILYLAIALIAISGLVCLGVDVAHARAVKIQLQCAADASARAGAGALGSGVTAVQSAVVTAAAANTADNVSVVVDPTNDIDFGTWLNGSFTVLTGANRSNANAVVVRCSRTAAKGNAVPAMFGSLLGLSAKDVSASATATGTTTPFAGFIGYNGVDLKNNAFMGSYSSSVTTNPTQAGSTGNMRAGSNGHITTKNNDDIDGDALLGPGATLSGVNVLGSISHQSTAIPTPTTPAWSPGTNPNSISQDYTVNSTTTLPGGTYWFTALNINANLSFSGPAVVYVNGDVAIGGTLAPSTGVPSDLMIYQYGSNSFGDSGSNGMDITACVIAPSSDFSAKNNLNFKGIGIFNSITAKNNATFFFDTSHGAADGTNVVSTVN